MIKEVYFFFGTRYPRLFKLLRFVISGGIGASTNIGILFFLTHIVHFWYLLSSIIAFIISVCVSFVFQKFWTFNDSVTNQMHLQIGWYILIAIINLSINTIIMYTLVDGVGLHYVISQVMSSLLIATESYFVYRRLFNRDILHQ